MDIEEVRSRLNADALSVARHLLPGGTLRGNEYEVADLSGGKGQSCKVHIGGDKNGVWAEYNGTEAGGLLDLFKEVHNCEIKEALVHAKKYLGVAEPSFETFKKKYKRPKKPQCHTPSGPVKAYLNDRGISDETILAYNIGEGARGIVFPFLRDGELIMYKVRQPKKLDSDGKKIKPVPGEAEMEPCLFGWQAVPGDAMEIVITEGEIDALSIFESTGIPALSVPFGGGGGKKHNWIDGEYHNLDRFERIYLCLDQDEPGELAEHTILSRLGAHRCFRVRLPHKDANDALREGTDIERYIKEATLKVPAELVSAEEFWDQVVASFRPREELAGYFLPWLSTFDKFSCLPGDVSVWCGKTNTGKSQITSHAVVYAIKQGAKVCMASLEMSPKQYLHRAVKQAGGTQSPTTEYMNRLRDEFFAGHLWCYNIVGKTDVERMLEVFLYARKRYGCDIFVIDSLMRLGVRNDDYAAQADAICAIVDFAVKNDVHVHLVCHARKSAEGGSTDIIRGAGEIADNAANIFLINRNKKAEDAIRAATTDEELRAAHDMPGVYLTLDKQRNGDFSGFFSLWFDIECYRYREKDEMIMGYLHNE